MTEEETIMIRLLLQVIGFVFLLFGFIGMLTPIPLGIVFFFIGLMFLIPTSPWVVRLIKKIRRKSRRVDTAFHAMTRRAPQPYKRVLRETENPDIRY